MIAIAKPPTSVLEEPVSRLQAGFRRTAYLGDRPHPDDRPWPSWCYANEPGQEHEVDHRHPFDASHSMDARIEVPASLYQGEYSADGARAATLEPRLDQRWQQPPVVLVAIGPTRAEGSATRMSGYGSARMTHAS